MEQSISRSRGARRKRQILEQTAVMLERQDRMALDASEGNVRKVQKLSRHADLRTLTVYDDNRTDAQGEMTGLLSGLL